MSDHDKESREREELTPELDETPSEEHTKILSDEEQPNSTSDDLLDSADRSDGGFDETESDFPVGPSADDMGFDAQESTSISADEPADPGEAPQLMGDDSALEVNTVPAASDVDGDDELTEVYVLEEEDATAFVHTDDLPASFDEPNDYMDQVGGGLKSEAHMRDDAATEFADAADVDDATSFDTSEDMTGEDNLDALTDEVEDELFAHRGPRNMEEDSTDLFDEVDESAGSPWGKVVACAAAVLVIGGIGFYFFQKTHESHAQPNAGATRPVAVAQSNPVPPPAPAVEPWRAVFRNQFLVAVKLGFSDEVNHEGR